jgi:uncharacterized protein (DUF1778 family)
MPKIPAYKMKSAFVQIRVTPDQRDQIREKARVLDKTVSSFILESLDRITPRRPQLKDPEVVALEQARVREIARLGNNLNQLAKWCNIYKEDAEAAQVIGALVSIEHELKKALGNDAH